MLLPGQPVPQHGPGASCPEPREARQHSSLTCSVSDLGWLTLLRQTHGLRPPGISFGHKKDEVLPFATWMD